MSMNKNKNKHIGSDFDDFLAEQGELEAAIVVTGDALHCERESMQLVVENGGDFLFQLKADQPTALAEAQRVVAAGTPLLPATPRIVGTAGSNNGASKSSPSNRPPAACRTCAAWWWSPNAAVPPSPAANPPS